MSFKVSNKSWILLSTTILIGLAFSVYFLVYVKGKEKTIVSNNFRVLQQIVSNIKSLEQSYLKNAETYNKQMSWGTNITEANLNLRKTSIDQERFKKLNNGVNYDAERLVFKERTFGSNQVFTTPYDIFFDNDLFHRDDIFDQIIISQIITKGESIEETSILYSNSYIGVLDSAYFNKTIHSAKNEITITDKNFISFNQKIDDTANIYISGLVDASKYNRQKRSVSPFIVFMLSVLLVLIILAMPLLKLKIMSIYERLYLIDVSFSVVSVLAGPAIFIVFLYAMYIYFGQGKKQIEYQLSELSLQIEQNFQSELKLLIDQIDAICNEYEIVADSSTIQSRVFTLAGAEKLAREFDETEASRRLNQHDYASMDDHFQRPYNIKGYRIYENVIQQPSISYKHLKAAFWATENAQLMVLLSAFNNPSYAQDLGHRYYLTNIINKKPDIFIDSDGEKYEIALESIKSVNDGSHEVGVGRASGGVKLPVFAISTKMASIMNPVLEEGFGFCILDETGKTLFHSDITKNMNENFIHETQDAFLYAINSHVDICKSVNYNGINQTIYMRPLGCLSGLYIATFVKNDAQFGVYTLSLISTFSLFVFFLLIILMVYLGLYFSVSTTSKLKQMAYLFNFFRPYETPGMYLIYKRLTLISTLAILYLILTIAISSQYFDFILSELVIVSVVLLIGSFYRIVQGLHEEQLFQRGLKVPGKTLLSFIAFVISLFLIARFIFLITKYDFLVVANAFIGLLLVWTIITELILGKKFINFPWLLNQVYEVVTVQRIYKMFLFSWVILLSIIPIHIFLNVTIESEQNIFKKFKSHELIKHFSDWEKQNEIEFADKFESQQHYEVFVNSMKWNGINAPIPHKMDSVNTKQFSRNLAGIRHPFFNRYYARIRPSYNDRASASANFIFDSASDSSWFFYDASDTIYFIAQSRFHGQPYNMISLERTGFFGKNLLIIFINTIVSLIILYNFLSFCLNRIYGFGYKNFSNNVDLVTGEAQIEHHLKKELFKNSSSYNNVFFVGVNTANTSYIKSYLKKSGESYYVLDFYDFNELQLGNSNKELENFEKLVSLGRFQEEWGRIRSQFNKEGSDIFIVVEHFEYGYNDIEMNKLKLEVLKYLIDCDNFKVLVKSEINPTKLLEYYDASLKNIEDLLKKPGISNRLELQAQADALKVDFKKWQHLLGSFVKCILPINIYKNEYSGGSEIADAGINNKTLQDELSHGEYLDMVNRYMKQDSQQRLSADDTVLTIQQISYPYYFSVWNSLSKEERYIVYDIAKDRYVNTTNTNAILSLLSKGILIYDHSLRLMNDSFTNFVLTKVNSDEALEMELISRKKGTWNTAFAVILLLIVSLVIFLSIGQQNFLNDLNAFLTAIVALVGLLIRFSGFLSFGGSKTIDA